MSQGEFTSLENLFMNGKHERVDVVVIYHGNPDSSKQSLKVMRSNVKCIFLTGMSHIDSTYRYSGWVDKGSYSKAEFTQRAQSFIKQRIRCGLILKRLRDETPLEEHFIPFRAYLGKRYKNDIEHGLVGENDDASSIIKGTGAEIAIREELKAQMKRYEAKAHQIKMKLNEKGSVKVVINPTSTRKSGRKRETLDDESDEESRSSYDSNIVSEHDSNE